MPARTHIEEGVDPMKARTFLGTICLVAAVCGSALAGTTGMVVTPREDLTQWDDLSRVSLAGTYQVQQREVHGVLGRNAEIELRSATAHIGFDLTGWLTVSGLAGKTRLEPKGQSRYEDMHELWGLGLSARLATHQIEGPELLRGRVGLMTDAQYHEYRAGEDEAELEWEEWVVDLKLRYELFAFGDGEGDRTLPFSTVLSLGPVWSDITGDFEARQTFGVVTGVAAFLTPDLALSWELQYYEQPTHSLSLGYHF
jgi:hypothetical protein